uniref:PH domain-containing protein n=1 Tax=Eptatretus burgeri TaxID=7764 RepID=A0A8C4QUJ1_EPTBU
KMDTHCTFAFVHQTPKVAKKLQNFGKRSNSIRRNPKALVAMQGWLHKQDSTGMKLWKKRWFVLCDYCLFYYKDNKEDFTLGSISLPSFQICLVDAEDKINRYCCLHFEYAPIAMHAGMRTYYFAADSADEMKTWMEMMGQACTVQNNGPQR